MSETRTLNITNRRKCMGRSQKRVSANISWRRPSTTIRKCHPQRLSSLFPDSHNLVFNEQMADMRAANMSRRNYFSKPLWHCF